VGDEMFHMKCVYEAANGVEAHMIANMLGQYDIATRIDGEYLTSGIGELPATGLVRVMADEENFERAREIIRKWEATSPPDTARSEPRRSFGPTWFLLGVVVTIGAVSWVYRPRPPLDGIDIDGDGRLDVRYIYNGQKLTRVERDSNRDGKVDAVYHYDARGLPTSAELDTDFDGRFETKEYFERGLLKTVDVDWDLDGNVDVHEEFTNGQLSTITRYAPDGYRIVKREYYEKGQLARADYDSDGDGVFDVTYRYDRYGEVVEATRNQ
jgi:hypothetical protein